MEGIKLDALFSLLLQGPGRGCPAGPSCARANSRPAGTGSGFSPCRVDVSGGSCCARGRPAPGPARRLRWLRRRLISNGCRITRGRLNQISLRLIDRSVVCGCHGTGCSDGGRRPRGPLRRDSTRPASASVFPTRFSWHRTSAPSNFHRLPPGTEAPHVLAFWHLLRRYQPINRFWESEAPVQKWLPTVCDQTRARG